MGMNNTKAFLANNATREPQLGISFCCDIQSRSSFLMYWEAFFQSGLVM